MEPQEFGQEIYFLNNPEDVQPAIDLANTISFKLDQLALQSDTKVLFVYLPPPSSGQPKSFQEERATSLAAARLDTLELGASDKIADAWLQVLDERGFAYLDLRDAFRSAETSLYWATDHHVNLMGHQLIGELLNRRVFEWVSK